MGIWKNEQEQEVQVSENIKSYDFILCKCTVLYNTHILQQIMDFIYKFRQENRSKISQCLWMKKQFCSPSVKK